MEFINRIMHRNHYEKVQPEPVPPVSSSKRKELPPELILHIFSYLTGDLKKVGMVCKLWSGWANELLSKKVKREEELQRCQDYINQLLKNEISAPEGVVLALKDYFQDPALKKSQDPTTITLRVNDIYISTLRYHFPYTILAPMNKFQEASLIKYRGDLEQLKGYLIENKETIPKSIFHLFMIAILNIVYTEQLLTTSGLVEINKSNLNFLIDNFTAMGFVFQAIQCIDMLVKKKEIKTKWNALYKVIQEKTPVQNSRERVLKCANSQFLKNLIQQSFEQGSTPKSGRKTKLFQFFR